MDTTDNLLLPYIMPSQAQKHVTHNEALRMLDALVQPAVAGIVDTPPAEPEPGLRVIVGEAPAGAFSGKALQLAQWSDGGWLFHAPQAGWVAYDLSLEKLLVFDGAAWEPVVGDLTEVEMLGVGTEADEDNRLAVASANTLLNHDGSDHRLKINKASAGDTASLLYQSGYSGRAEMGLAGNDDFSIKVSADGLAWREAMRIEAATGRVQFPGGGVREQLTAPRTYHVSASGSDLADGLSPAAAFATLQRAIDVALSLDPQGQQVTIQIADGSYSGASTMARPLFDGGTLIIRGNVTTPASVVLAGGSGTPLLFTGNGVRAQVEGVQVSGFVGIWARFGAIVFLRQKNRFAACTARHVGADNSAYLEIVGEVQIAGAAPSHLVATQTGHVLLSLSTVVLTGTPAFSTGFVRAEQMGLVTAFSNTFTGAATGSRYQATTNAVIAVNGGGASVFPGNAAGAVATGGQYG